MIRIDPIIGTWTAMDFPRQVVVGGVTYNKTTRVAGVLGVVVHYRENVEFKAKHLFVFDDGTFRVTHLDEYNPDLGHVIAHLAFDASSIILPPLLLGVALLVIVKA